MSDRALSFWQSVLRNEPSEGDIHWPDSAQPSRLIDVGESTHLLEWLDVLVDEEDWPDEPAHREVLEASRRQRTHTLHRNRYLRELIDEIDSEPLDRPYAWLKGSTFLRRDEYPRGIRRMSDVDLLLRKEDISYWDDYFQSLGFSGYRDPAWMNSDRFDGSVSSTFYYGERGEQEVLIDVHWHLIDFPARRAFGDDFPMAPVWDGVSDHVMAPHHRVIYLCDHAFTHNFWQWKFVTDLRRVATETIDEDAFRAEVERMGLGDSVGLGLRVAEELGEERPLELNYSEYVQTETYDQFLRRVFSRDTRKGDYLKVCLKQREGVWQKLQFLLWILWPPVSAVPGVDAPPTGWEWPRIYLKRFRRVVSEGRKILFRG